MPLRFALFAALLLAPARALQVDRGEVQFVAHGSLGMRFEGKTSDLAASSTPDAYEFQVQLATLDTGIELRDRHMREEYLDVKSFPVARMRVPNSCVPAAGEGGSCKGELTLHGQTHPVDVAFQLRRSSGYDVPASLQIDMREYGIATPKYMGVTVKPQVEVTVDFHVESP